jgi:hypothetical protein
VIRPTSVSRRSGGRRPCTARRSDWALGGRFGGSGRNHFPVAGVSYHPLAWHLRYLTKTVLQSVSNHPLPNELPTWPALLSITIPRLGGEEGWRQSLWVTGSFRPRVRHALLFLSDQISRSRLAENPSSVSRLNGRRDRPPSWSTRKDRRLDHKVPPRHRCSACSANGRLEENGCRGPTW